MHLVLRASKAKGAFSFKRANHARNIGQIVGKFSAKYGVRVISLANVGNHLHFHIKIGNRFTYVRFIRAVTAAIAMTVTGRNRWSKAKWEGKFWDYRPFTRAIQSYQEYLNLNDYIRINKWEGAGKDRAQAYYFIKQERGVWNKLEALVRSTG